MSNLFKTTYEQELKIEQAYDEAERAGDQKRMAELAKAYDEFCKEGDTRGRLFNRIYREYRQAKKRGNEHLDFHEVIWDNEVEDLISCLKKNGIEHFTFSSTWSSAVETAWLFQEAGCKLEGLIRVNGEEDGWRSGTFKKIPAYLFRIG